MARSNDLVTWTPSGGVFPGTGSPITLNYPNIYIGNPKFFFRARVGP